MVLWRRFFHSDNDGDHRGIYHDEFSRLLPISRTESTPSAYPPREVTKVALRLKYQLEQVISCEVDESKLVQPHGTIITKDVVETAKQAGGDKYAACVVYCLLVCKSWFQRRAVLELWDAEMHNARATACEVIAKRIIESEEDQGYLLADVLLKRYSIIRGDEETHPANVIERAVDLHALRVIGASGYQKCIKHLWMGWLVQDDQDPSRFVEYVHKDRTEYWVHFDPDRMRAPVYQNAVQVFISMLYLVLYTGSINTVNKAGDLDVVEGLLYLMTLGFVCDEVSKLWKVGRQYFGFWNAFNATLYALLTVSFVTRIIALSHATTDSERARFNELSYNFLAFSAPMFWMRLLLFLDTFRFFGTMMVVLKVMMRESIVFFALLVVVIVGFLQAFMGMDNVDSEAKATTFILQSMANTVMQSPDFAGFESFAPPFGMVLYYVFTFVVMVILLNILIALYNSAYEDITGNASDEYMALFSQKTMRFVRAPDENVFIPPFNLIEIGFLIVPFEWWMDRQRYLRLNDYVMAIIYSPLLLITAWIETRAAQKYEIEEEEEAFEDEEWMAKVAATKPHEIDVAVELQQLRTMVETLLEK